jgi:hypothetical protein
LLKNTGYLAVWAAVLLSCGQRTETARVVPAATPLEIVEQLAAENEQAALSVKADIRSGGQGRVLP